MGGLPLGVVLISDEKEESITKAFELLMEILPSNSFFNSGKKVPPLSWQMTVIQRNKH